MWPDNVLPIAAFCDHFGGLGYFYFNRQLMLNFAFSFLFSPSCFPLLVFSFLSSPSCLLLLVFSFLSSPSYLSGGGPDRGPAQLRIFFFLSKINYGLSMSCWARCSTSFVSLEKDKLRIYLCFFAPCHYPITQVRLSEGEVRVLILFEPGPSKA